MDTNGATNYGESDGYSQNEEPCKISESAESFYSSVKCSDY